MLVLLTSGMAAAIYFGIFSPAPAQWTPEKTVNTELLATFVWTLLVVYTASDLHRFDPVIPFFGKHSLYLYLSHQFIFMRVINNLTESSFAVRFCISAAATIVIAPLLGIIISTLTGRINKVFSHKERPANASLFLFHYYLCTPFWNVPGQIHLTSCPGIFQIIRLAFNEFAGSIVKI